MPEIGGLVMGFKRKHSRVDVGRLQRGALTAKHYFNQS